MEVMLSLLELRYFLSLIISHAESPIPGSSSGSSAEVANGYPVRDNMTRRKDNMVYHY